MESAMRNLISFNQFVVWQHLVNTIDKFKEQTNTINEHFECLIKRDDAKKLQEEVECKSTKFDDSE